MAQKSWLRPLHEDGSATQSLPILFRLFDESALVRGGAGSGPLMPSIGRAAVSETGGSADFMILTLPSIALDALEVGSEPRTEATLPGPSNAVPSAASAMPPLFYTSRGANSDLILGTSITVLNIAAPSGSAIGAVGTVGLSRGVQQIVISSGLMVDMGTRQILTGGAEDPVPGSGDNDTFISSSGGPDPLVDSLPMSGLETVLLDGGGSYDLVSLDDDVARGALLTVNAGLLGTDDSIAFDGSQESDGRFAFLGGDGADRFSGGAGADLIFGEGGGDTLGGGAGADRFGYADASESSSAGYDTLVDFDPASDRIDLPVAVTGFDAAVETGSLSAASFDDDLLAALGADGLGAGRAMFFAPDGGDLAGTIFLIVDGNGEAGYQAGEDFVFALGAGNLADLSGHTGFFI